MSKNSNKAQTFVLKGSTAKTLLQQGCIRHISVQNAEGQVLIEAPIMMDIASIVPGVFKAPVRAAIRATTLVTGLIGLKVVVKQDC